MDNLQAGDHIEDYAEDIRKIAYHYWWLWPGQDRYYSVDDLMQAGRIAVWNISKKRPEKLGYRAYVRAAIRYGIFGVVKKSVPRRRAIHLVRQGEDAVPLVDVLPVYDDHAERASDLDELYYYIGEHFSKESAASLRQIVDQSDDVHNLNLSELPATELKDKVKLVASMDLSDEEMAMYAEVVVGARERFPRDYVVGQVERARKYIVSLLNHLDISPEEFASMTKKGEFLKKYKLHSFYQKTYGGKNFVKLVSDVFPDLPTFAVGRSNRWRGREGLINAYNAVDWVGRKSRKKPEDIMQEDFRKVRLGGLLNSLFDKSHKKAVEFRWPGTYPELSEEVKQLWKGITDE